MCYDNVLTVVFGVFLIVTHSHMAHTGEVIGIHCKSERTSVTVFSPDPFVIMLLSFSVVSWPRF